ncbi:MAG: acyl-CoA thioesterase [Cytophagaceae bacterium]|nr:acyl-CoA thioesterase [Gemmatimonadaceae bacterium]
MGVVYHAEYLVYCEIGRTEMVRALGLPYAEMERQGVMLAVTEANLRFHAAARYDDLLLIETHLTDVRSRRISFEYLIRNAATQARLVSVRTQLVALDAGSRPTAIPPRLRELLESGRDQDR